MDDLDKVRLSRRIPDALEAMGQQMLLNLALTEGVEIWMRIGDAEPVDYRDIIIQRHEEINKGFDDLMTRLGLPKGTGRLL